MNYHLFLGYILNKIHIYQTSTLLLDIIDFYMVNIFRGEFHVFGGHCYVKVIIARKVSKLVTDLYQDCIKIG